MKGKTVAATFFYGLMKLRFAWVSLDQAFHRIF